MKSREAYIKPDSDYYVYSPSMNAKSMFFYPLWCGQFTYECGYRLSRTSYDSFLIIYVESGTLDINCSRSSSSYTASAGSFVFIDCYSPHSYEALSECRCLWCHFDGPLARSFYEQITGGCGVVFSLENPYPVISKLEMICDTFRRAKPIREALLSKYINDILTVFLISSSIDAYKKAESVSETAIAYINENFAQNISIDRLASLSGLSQYYFIRRFKRETGFTPHEYIMRTRISFAGYMLRSSSVSIKDICFSSGFTNESAFCAAFKLRTGLTPTQYRAAGGLV